jgi:hypothetical protein
MKIQKYWSKLILVKNHKEKNPIKLVNHGLITHMKI